MANIQKIISSAQMGADRGALDFTIGTVSRTAAGAPATANL